MVEVAKSVPRMIIAKPVAVNDLNQNARYASEAEMRTSADQPAKEDITRGKLSGIARGCSKRIRDEVERPNQKVDLRTAKCHQHICMDHHRL